jgi:hypothetical protein
LTDASLASIARLTELEEINLSGARIDGSGFVHLARLEKLKVSVIPGSVLDDAALMNLGRLTSLRELYLVKRSGGRSVPLRQSSAESYQMTSSVAWTDRTRHGSRWRKTWAAACSTSWPRAGTARSLPPSEPDSAN